MVNLKKGKSLYTIWRFAFFIWVTNRVLKVLKYPTKIERGVLMGKNKKPRGRPRTFRSGAHLFECMQAFCDDIIAHGYNVLPSKTEFCRWYSNQFEKPLSRRAVWAAVNEQYPDAKSNIEELVSDVLAQGAALGHWNSSITIFVLKNWCRWSDKHEPEATSAITVEMVDLIGEEGD